MDRFAGRAGLIVGAAGGMGEATALRLAREGASVVLADIQGDEAQRVAEGIGRSAIAVALDVQDEAAVARTVLEAERSVGALDFLVVTSGVFVSKPFFDTSRDDWAALLSVNVHGAVACMRAVGARMKERRRGSIVVVASQSARIVRLHQAAYGASKAALTYATKALGLELAPFGVRVNVVQPGVTETPLAQRVWAKDPSAKTVHVTGSLERYRPPIPLGKVGTSEDVAAAIAFLLSDEAGHITMTELLIDGGTSFMA